MSNEPQSPGANRILVVDDDAGIRLLISHHLQKKGYAVVVAAGVAEAQALLTENAAARLDAVVTDYLMPDGTGLDLLGWLKQRDDSLAAIFVTGVGERNLVKQSLRTGACDFLDKPVQIHLLLDAVAKAVDLTHRQRAQHEGRVLRAGSRQAPAVHAGDESRQPAGHAGGLLASETRGRRRSGQRLHPRPERLLIVVADDSGISRMIRTDENDDPNVIRSLLHQQL